MLRARTVARLAMSAVLALVLAACGAAGVDESRSTPDDPALVAAADVIKPILEGSYATTYAGLTLDHGQHEMIIYRRPDSHLDAEVRAKIPDVNVILRDAKYSMTQMAKFVDEVLDDADYWRGQGIHVNGAAPKFDGSGIEVLVNEDGKEVESKMAQHYSAMTVTIRKQTVIHPVYTGSLPPMGADQPSR
jgi:hypothetical protein